MLEWFWLGMNAIVGVPLALVAGVFVREGLRAGVALAVGFRVFELRWGVGPAFFDRPIGPVNLSIAPWPIAGATLARSGVPRRHRLARAIVAIAPLTAQLLWLALRAAHAPPIGAAMSAGPAVLAALDIANALLITIHCLLPVEFSPGVQSDVRLLLDSIFAQTHSDRTARASYYARLAVHRLERADVEAARTSLEKGLVQLGREAMLVRCHDRFVQTDLDSVIDQGDCADDLRRLIEDAEPKRADLRADWSLRERIRERAISAAPASFLLLVVAIAQADSLALGVESVLRRQGERVAAMGEAPRCEAQIRRWQQWIGHADRWFPLEGVKRSDRHATLAELARCQGDLTAAAAHQGEAMLAANAARTLPATAIATEPERWLDNEMRMAELLRQAAAVENERRSFRRALGTLGKAERRLESLRSRIAVWPDEEARSQADATIAAEHTEILALREQVLASLAGS